MRLLNPLKIRKNQIGCVLSLVIIADIWRSLIGNLTVSLMANLLIHIFDYDN